MRTALRRGALLAACLSLLVAPPVSATDITVDGTYIDDATGESGRWEGVFEATDGSRLNGAITFYGPQGSLTMELEGRRLRELVQFQFTNASGEQCIYKGKVIGSHLDGDYVCGQREGTITGTARATASGTQQ